MIYGSPSDDEIKGTGGADLIDCGKGKDVVRKAQNTDEISDSCEKVKNKLAMHRARMLAPALAALAAAALARVAGSGLATRAKGRPRSR